MDQRVESVQTWEDSIAFHVFIELKAITPEASLETAIDKNGVGVLIGN